MTRWSRLKAQEHKNELWLAWSPRTRAFKLQYHEMTSSSQLSMQQEFSKDDDNAICNGNSLQMHLRTVLFVQKTTINYNSALTALSRIRKVHKIKFQSQLIFSLMIFNWQLSSTLPSCCWSNTLWTCQFFRHSAQPLVSLHQLWIRCGHMPVQATGQDWHGKLHHQSFTVCHGFWSKQIKF